MSIKPIDKIEIDGEERNVYVCDRQAKCNKSKNCGTLCTRTFDQRHAVNVESGKGRND